MSPLTEPQTDRQTNQPVDPTIHRLSVATAAAAAAAVTINAAGGGGAGYDDDSDGITEAQYEDSFSVRPLVDRMPEAHSNIRSLRRNLLSSVAGAAVASLTVSCLSFHANARDATERRFALFVLTITHR